MSTDNVAVLAAAVNAQGPYMPATRALPRFVILAEHNLSGSGYQGAPFVNWILGRAGYPLGYADWEPITTPCYGCVVVAHSGSVGFVMAANDDAAWMADGRFVSRVRAEGVAGFMWPKDLAKPTHALPQRIGPNHAE